ncbi:NadR type nicotinamide-nucleotide adenylyltransferase [Kibdelosporangium banguiense]|uniref:NadR type nicotinamide-nucleotide adenylyltransferase n=1 Tax=Kibdelosporangium banguiense TaxID=1365924 RepID=A0ABS4U0N8_9PSEU|nr:AAA family ATPase [Kibdelosporangium banguiense]MBP2330214.1 NadR type nicotinamide-nucleotide adenylyltransferase [Kibdelosporangium banguiense]
MSKFEHALVLGKFYPPHLGHHHLVRTAAAASNRTTVAVLASSVESIPLADRVSWMTREHSGDEGVVVLGDIDDYQTDYDDNAIWEAHVGIFRSVLSRRAIQEGDPASAAVDAVFTSEDYGQELAKRLGAQHVLVDLDRTVHPMSGTAVRADPMGRWTDLAPATQAGLAARIVVVGAESTGTTTLSRALAEHYRTAWVPEHGRLHTEEKLIAAQAFDERAGIEDLVWTVGDFVDIAARQAKAEDEAAGAGPILVCDNDPWAATVWCERYLGCAYPQVTEAVSGRKPALYLLTDHQDVPFEQDGWRDGEHLREWMTGLFERRLDERGVSWARLTGSRQNRLEQAINAVEDMLARHFRYADPLG